MSSDDNSYWIYYEFPAAVDCEVKSRACTSVVSNIDVISLAPESRGMLTLPWKFLKKVNDYDKNNLDTKNVIN